MVFTEIADRTIDISPDYIRFNKTTGANLIFNGRIRADENGSKIKGITYEYYHGMAELELSKLANKTLNKYNLNAIVCVHRVGFVPCGESAVYVEINSAHRQESFKAMEWFMDTLKDDIPIWKKIEEDSC